MFTKEFDDHRYGFRNMVTYCLRCTTMLYWDQTGKPGVLNDGNQEMLECIESSCRLVFVGIPVQYCDYGELDLLKLAFEEAGVPEDLSETGALRLVLAHTSPAAA